MFQDATRTLQLLSGRTGLGAAADSRRKRGSDS
jgi:hypothetical protein